MIRLGNNEVLKTLTKTLTFVDADVNAGGSTIALPERCSDKLIILMSGHNTLWWRNKKKISKLFLLKSIIFRATYIYVTCDINLEAT